MKLHYEKQQKKFNLIVSEHTGDPDYLHWHKMVEICLMVEGRCDFLIGGHHYSADEGDLIVINSGEIHQFIHRFGDCKIDICTFDPIVLYNLGAEAGSIATHIRSAELEQAGISRSIADCFLLMRQERDNTQVCAPLLFQSALMQLYGLLLRHFGRKEDTAQVDMARRLNFQQVLEYISQNYTENLTLDTLAAQFHYSAGYISELFRSCAGVNFKQYVDNIRVMEAVRLLQTTQLPIGEISSACGFENIRTFNNVFKRLTGCTPREVKKKGH